jgi:hypothetical protein
MTEMSKLSALCNVTARKAWLLNDIDRSADPAHPFSWNGIASDVPFRGISDIFPSHLQWVAPNLHIYYYGIELNCLAQFGSAVNRVAD